MTSHHRPASRPPARFTDRREAGRHLAARLRDMSLERPVVLALPRGGVPVGYEIALALDAPLDLILARKLGMPGNPEFALGAVVEGPTPQRVISADLVDRQEVPLAWIEQEAHRQEALIQERCQRWRQGAPLPSVAGRTVILVDDGIATGSTANAALLGLAGCGAIRTVLAVPVAPRDVLMRVDISPKDFVCVIQPDDFLAVGEHYVDFDQVSEAEVDRLLAARRSMRPLH